MPFRFRSTTQRKLFSLLLCYSLLLTCVAPFAIARAKRFPLVTGRSQNNDTAVAGAPEGIFPNLDEVRNAHLPQPIAPPSVASTLRSLRNPLAPRTVLHVGDPLPSPSILPSPLPSPSTSPLASPSLWPSPPPSPSPLASPLPLPLESASGARMTTWTTTGPCESRSLAVFVGVEPSTYIP
jgi:hypothetical protein